MNRFVSELDWLTLVLSLVGKFGATAGFAVIYVFTAELFPTVVRNSTIGVCSFCARIGGILAPFVGDLVSPALLMKQLDLEREPSHLNLNIIKYDHHLIPLVFYINHRIAASRPINVEYINREKHNNLILYKVMLYEFCKIFSGSFPLGFNICIYCDMCSIGSEHCKFRVESKLPNFIVTNHDLANLCHFFFGGGGNT